MSVIHLFDRLIQSCPLFFMWKGFLLIGKQGIPVFRYGIIKAHAPPANDKGSRFMRGEAVPLLILQPSGQ